MHKSYSLEKLKYLFKLIKFCFVTACQWIEEATIRLNSWSYSPNNITWHPRQLDSLAIAVGISNVTEFILVSCSSCRIK